MANATKTKTFVIDKTHSEAVFQVRHLITKVRGRFANFDGKIEFDEERPDVSSVNVTIDAAASTPASRIETSTSARMISSASRRIRPLPSRAPAW